MVAERVVLGRVEHLEQRRRRDRPTSRRRSLSTSSSSTTGFIEPASVIARTMRPGLGADVGAAVTADLGLVADAAEGDADEACGPWRGRPTRRGCVLPTPGGPTRARIAPSPRRPAASRRRRGTASTAALGAQLADGEVLDDALLHVVEAGVVGVEDARGPREVVALVGRRVPHGQLEHAVEPGADPALLGALAAGALEPVELLLDRLAHLLGQRQLASSLVR